MQRKIIALSLTVALGAASESALASGFALLEQNASGLGNAYAGGAAVAEDASTVFFNPAGMSRLPGNEFVISGDFIRPSAKFGNSASALAAAQTTLGGSGGDAGGLSFVPDVYFTSQINEKITLGLGVNSPFGLKTNYDPTWMGRFQAIQSKLETTNLNPSISYKVNDAVSLGFGLNYQKIKGNLTSATNYSAAALSVPPAPNLALLGAIGGAGVEGVSTVTGSDSGWGYNLGVLFNPSENTRIGLAYRSTINYTLTGTVSFTNRPALLAAGIPDGPISLAIKTPDTFSASVFYRIDSKWDVMGDLTWTGWSVFQQLNVVRSTGAPLLNVQENWRDTWRISGGANYHYNETWTARIGLALDQTPTSDLYRTARIPDGNRTWLSVGGQYKPSKANAVDFGYSHLFVGNSAVNQSPAGQGTLSGTYQNSVDILGLQYTHSF